MKEKPIENKSLFVNVSLRDFALYECTVCLHRFVIEDQEKLCRKCGNRDSSTLAPLFQVNSLAREMLYTRGDWHGG